MGNQELAEVVASLQEQVARLEAWLNDKEPEDIEPRRWGGFYGPSQGAPAENPAEILQRNRRRRQDTVVNRSRPRAGKEGGRVRRRRPGDPLEAPGKTPSQGGEQDQDRWSLDQQEGEMR